MSQTTTIGHDATSGEPIQLPLSSRVRGLYVLGKQGMGKSNFLLNLIAQDLRAGYGVCVLDPHGDLTTDVLALMPPERERDVILLDMQDTAHPFAFDLLSGIDPADPASLAAGVERVVGIFKKVWGDTSWGPRLEDLLANAVHTLLANPGTTLANLPTLLTNPAYRQQLAANVDSAIVQDYWAIEYDTLTPRGQAGIYAPLMNKVRTFLRHPILSRIVSQPGRTVDLRDILANSNVLLVRLNPDLEEATSLLGTSIVVRLLEAALGRKAIPENQRPYFMLYADEFQLFATPTFGRLLQEARKYRVGTTLAHQFRSQLSTSYLRDAVKAAVNIVCFQVTSDDARELSREFLPARDDTFIQAAEEHPNPTIRESMNRLHSMLSGFTSNTLRVFYVGNPKATSETVYLDRLETLNRLLETTVTGDFQGGNPKYSILDADMQCEKVPDDLRQRVRDCIDVLTGAVKSGELTRLVIPAVDVPTLVTLPEGHAAAKLRLTDGMHQHLLAIPLAIKPEDSTTVHTMITAESDQDAVDALAILPFLPNPNYMRAGFQARGIRDRNRAHFEAAPPHGNLGVIPPTSSPPSQSRTPATRPLPVMAEVEIDDE